MLCRFVWGRACQDWTQICNYVVWYSVGFVSRWQHKPSGSIIFGEDSLQHKLLCNADVALSLSPTVGVSIRLVCWCKHPGVMGAASIVFNFLTPCTVTKFDENRERNAEVFCISWTRRRSRSPSPRQMFDTLSTWSCIKRAPTKRESKYCGLLPKQRRETQYGS
jgi:hypothetical protein